MLRIWEAAEPRPPRRVLRQHYACRLLATPPGSTRRITSTKPTGVHSTPVVRDELDLRITHPLDAPLGCMSPLRHASCPLGLGLGRVHNDTQPGPAIWGKVTQHFLTGVYTCAGRLGGLLENRLGRTRSEPPPVQDDEREASAPGRENPGGS